MSRLSKILSIAVLLLGLIVWLQYMRAVRLADERDRFRMNSTALLSEVKRMQVDSATMALDTKALRLTVDEYQEFRARDAETIRRLGVRIRNLEAAARHEIKVKAPVDAVIRDTLVIRDTVPLLRQKVEMITPHIQLSALIEENRLKGDIKIPVTLTRPYGWSTRGAGSGNGSRLSVRPYPATIRMWKSSIRSISKSGKQI